MIATTTSKNKTNKQKQQQIRNIHRIVKTKTGSLDTVQMMYFLADPTFFRFRSIGIYWTDSSNDDRRTMDGFEREARPHNNAIGCQR